MKQKVKRRIISIILAFGLAVSSAATVPVKVFAGTGKAGVMTAPTTVPTTVPDSGAGDVNINISDSEIVTWANSFPTTLGGSFNLSNHTLANWVAQFPIQNFTLSHINVDNNTIAGLTQVLFSDNLTINLNRFNRNRFSIDIDNPAISNRISTLVSRIFGYPSILLDDNRIGEWANAFPGAGFYVQSINLSDTQHVGAWISSFPIWICDPVNISANFTSLPSRLNGSRLFSRRKFAAFARRWNDLARSLQNSLDNISVVPDNSTVVSENSKELPGNSTVVSENSKELPGNSTAVSENSKELPDNSTAVSENSKELPGNSTVVSENSKELSDNSTAVSENSKELPGNSTVVSENSKELPGNSTAVSENSKELPDNSTVVSENSKELPGNSTVVSENSKELPDNSTAVSENSRELPDNSTAVSANSKELSDNSTVVSENSKELPGNSTAVSENSKELSGNSTVVSENSKELPGNSTVVSENSRELPGNSTVVFDNRSEDLIYLPSANSSTGLTSFYRRLNYSRLFPHGLTDLTNFLPSNLTNLVFTSFLTTGLTSLLCSDLIGLSSTNISDGLTSFLPTNSSAGFPALPG